MGGGAETSYEQSPAQRLMYGYTEPMFTRLMESGAQQSFDRRGRLTPPSAVDNTMRALGRLPDVEGVMPTSSWWDSLSPQVLEGLYEPYNMAGRNMLETMGYRGMAGSPRAGLTGAAGAAMGQLYADAGKDVGLNAWQMTQPALAADWNLRSNALLNAEMMDYQSSLGAWQMPWQAMMPTLDLSQPTGVISPGSGQQIASTATGALGGAAAGASMGAMYGSAVPGYGTAIGAGLGAIVGGVGGYASGQ